MNVKCLFTSPVEPVLIATAKCYNAKPSMKAVVNCVKRGHLSVLRHGCSVFEVSGVSRALLQQVARHHHINLTVRSQRYCDEGGFGYAVPHTVKDKGEALQVFEEAMKQANENYKKLRELGIPKEDARYVLPGACYTTFVISTNWQGWWDFLKTRLNPRVMNETRELAICIYEYFLEHEQLKLIFEQLVPDTH